MDSEMCSEVQKTGRPPFHKQLSWASLRKIGWRDVPDIYLLASYAPSLHNSSVYGLSQCSDAMHEIPETLKISETQTQNVP